MTNPEPFISPATLESTKDFISAIKRISPNDFTMSYDSVAETAYICLEDKEATDSVLTEDNVLLRYCEDKLIGLTLINVCKDTDL
jgi:uncharacterized protein YuzE